VADHRDNLTQELQRALATVDASGLGTGISELVRTDADDHARALFEACGARPEAVGLATFTYTADLLGAIAVDLAAHRAAAERLIARLQNELGLPGAAVGRELLRTGRLLELPVKVAVEVTLALLHLFAGSEEISLWTEHEDGGAALVSTASAPSEAARAAAAAVLTRASTSLRDGAVFAVRIEAPRRPAQALVAVGVAPADPVTEGLLAAAAPLLAALHEGDSLPGSNKPGPDQVVGAVERRLARLRFDLHDGPQQDLHLLGQDLRLFRDQLRPMIAGDPNQDRALGRLDDLEAQLVALDGDLRRLATTVESPFLAPSSLPDALRQLTDAFAERTGVLPQTQLRGPLASLTDSQQIALLSLIRESLSNIRRHSDARSVTIVVQAGPEGVHVEVSDDGGGFDPQSTLVRAARAGRLGLLGMHERVRMLGGRTQIDSRPGGPTVISADLPPWSSA
jgi:signal transduction histidine kinase